MQDRLRDVASMLRQGGAIDPESRRALAALVDELRKALDDQNVPPAEVARLAASTAHLTEALHQRKETGLLAKAREGLELAALEAEAHVPFLVGLARRVVDALAGIGI
jgi:hypothetical protein